MKFSEMWLREWIGSEPSVNVLYERLNMAGLEVEGLSAVAGQFSGVVVAQVVRVEAHPEADRLRVCQVDSGVGDPLTIVCGAPNVFVGMKAPLAKVGAVLPDGMVIQASRLRGILSEGMLCAPVELGLGEGGARGLLVLPADAPLGQDLRTYLSLDDRMVDLSITPNRGDCLSIAGLSTEIAALAGNSLKFNGDAVQIPAQHNDVFPVEIVEPVACSRYAGRVIRHIRSDVVTPVWLQERLRRGGLRSIHPVVDVTNYVMLELGQPMHAFDLSKLSNGVFVRYAKENESLALLDEQTVHLDTDTLVIADDRGPVAIAGVMGGLASAVSEKTQTIFLESAFFQPDSVARAVRTYQLGSESSFRFERGVDPLLQVRAIERATALILEIVGGEAGPVIDVKDPTFLPKSRVVTLRQTRLNQIAGIELEAKHVTLLLQRPGFQVRETVEGWQITVPARRFDVTREIDLIEEVLRLYGYENIPAQPPHFGRALGLSQAGRSSSIASLGRLLSDRGYHEVISYSFIDQKMQDLFVSEGPDIELVNPITSTMNVMRKTLWPGLISALLHNLNRQQSRVRLFETGKRFIRHDEVIFEQPVISGLITGSLDPLQWGDKERDIDFYDIKGDVEYLLSSIGYAGEVSCLPGLHSALHPGQTADVFCAGRRVGILGALHPKILQEFDLTQSVMVFELETDDLILFKTPLAREVSKFPLIRRDISILLDSSIPANVIQDTIRSLGDELLQSVTIFDVYQGKGVSTGKKSMALALVMQHPERTLTDEEVSDRMQHIISGLQKRFRAELRG